MVFFIIECLFGLLMHYLTPPPPSLSLVRFGSLDRRRCHSGRAETQTNLDQQNQSQLDTPELIHPANYHRDQLERYLPNHHNNSHINSQNSPQLHNQSLHQQHLQQQLQKQQQHHYNNNNSRSHSHTVSSSKLHGNNSSSHLPTQVHNISSSSLSHGHNTTASSIGSSSSGGLIHKPYSSQSSQHQHHNYHPNSNAHHQMNHHQPSGTFHHCPPPPLHHVPRSGHAVEGVSPSYRSRNGMTNGNHLQQLQHSSAALSPDNIGILTQQPSYYNPPHHNSPADGVHNAPSHFSHHLSSYHAGHQSLVSDRQQVHHHIQNTHVNETVHSSGNSSVNCSFDTRVPSEDCVDSNIIKAQYHNSIRSQPKIYNSYLQNNENLTSDVLDKTLEAETSSETVHTLVRTNSGRSYMETTFVGDSSPASSTTSNQENIPPSTGRGMTGHSQHQHLPPLRATASQLRASSSVTPADMAQPKLLPAVDLVPLRATKSSSELPPLRATNSRSDYSGHLTMNNNNNNIHKVNVEPLMTLSEAAKLKKDREREWYETSLDSPVNGRRTHRNPIAEIVVNKVLNSTITSNTLNNSGSNLNTSTASHNVHNTSSCSTYPSSNEGSDNQVSSSNTSSNGRNQSIVITTGTYQPSREVSKPFEMSDFYKYSTKYRKQGNSSSNSSFSADSSATMSPVLPPRAQVVVSKTAPPPSPNVIAQQSTPAAQQKGVYQSLAPYTCEGVSPAAGSPQQQVNTPPAGWDGGAVHQALPATVTTKRSATLV